MGNRAIIALEKSLEAPAIYLHWNGSPEQILAFLKAAQFLGVRSCLDDPTYFLGRLGQIIANYCEGTTGMGLGLVSQMDDGDNGLYVIKGWDVVENEGYDMRKEMPCASVFLNAVKKNIAHYPNKTFDAVVEQWNKETLPKITV